MARTARPWYWVERNAWYVNKDGRRHQLGQHPPDAAPPKKIRGKWLAPAAIQFRFHELMATAESEPTRTGAVRGLLVVELFDKYLDWCEKHRSPRTYEGYRWHLQRFSESLPTPNSFAALDLKPFHVIEWLDKHPTWGATYRRNAIASVQRAYSWAEELGHIASNPVRKIKKPSPKRRDRFVTPEDWVKIRNSYAESDPFRLFLEFVWETGCRPQEARHVEVRHVRYEKALVAIPPEEAKGKKKWRLIRLEGRALEVIGDRLASVKSGKLFLNRSGRPWTSSALNCRFGRLKSKLGVKHFPYGFRHGFANRMLVSGTDHLTVAELLGHSDGTMLAKVYQHLDQSDAHLREALKRAIPNEAKEPG